MHSSALSIYNNNIAFDFFYLVFEYLFRAQVYAPPQSMYSNTEKDILTNLKHSIYSTK